MGDGLWLGQRDRDCWLFGEMPGDEGSCKRWGGEPLSVPRGDAGIGGNEPGGN